MIYLSIFTISLLAATLLPLSSEATLLYYRERDDIWMLFLFAGFGNVLGSIINYFIGKKGTEYLLKRKKLSATAIEKSEVYFQKYGIYALLFSWLPIIGDPLTFVAGSLHYDIKRFIAIVSLAKFGRYCILLLFVT